MSDADEELAAGRLGRTVGGRWLLERVLGIGGMATVYAGRDASGAVAAIKILHPEMGVRREVRERFLREGYVANHIGHPGVVRALEHGDAGDEVFLAMELLQGETLRARVKRHGTLPLAEVLDYAEQILDVLAVAHDKGVVHRDLKPDNLFVGLDQRVKILDFGLARVLDGMPSQFRTRTGVALGTLAYMAPEQALGRRAEIDGRVDLFALGATIFRVVSGRRVHEADSEAELLMAMASRPAPPLLSVAPQLPAPLGAVVDLALAFTREARYPDARTMLGDVRALKAGRALPYATARLAAREEATRAEGPAPVSQHTQPLSARPASVPRPASSTVPMHALAAPRLAGPLPAASRNGGGAPPFAGAAGHTEPLVPPLGGNLPPVVASGVAQPTQPIVAASIGTDSTEPGVPPSGAVAPPNFAQTLPSTLSPVGALTAASGTPLSAPRRSGAGLVIAIVASAAVLLVAAGALGWYALNAGKESESAAHAASTALPAAANAPSESVPAAPPTPAAPAERTTTPATVTAEPASDPKPNPGARVAAPAPAAPAAGNTAAPAAPSPPVAPSATATAAPSAAPPAPSSSSGATAKPALPAPPPPTTEPERGAGAPPLNPKRGRGRGRGD